MLSALLSLILVISLCPFTGFVTSAIEENGQCGENVYWTFDDSSGTLTIFGTGDMYDNAQLCENKDDVISVVVECGVTSISSYAFNSCKNLTSVTLFNTLTSIGEWAFSECENLESINIPNSLKAIGNFAFYGCPKIEYYEWIIEYYNYGSIPNDRCTIGECFNEIENGVLSLVYDLIDNDNLSEAEKALIVHDRIATTTDYDKELKQISGTLYGVLVDHKGVCQGYAEAYSVALDRLGIENYLEFSTELCHIWNIVVLDGEPYHVDITWDDPIYGDFHEGYVEHTNFLVSSEKFINVGEHFAQDFSTEPNSTLYEDKFWVYVTSQSCVIDGDIYLLSSDNNTIYRIEDDNAVPVMNIPEKGITNQSTGSRIILSRSTADNDVEIAAIGTKIFYLGNDGLWSYDVKSSEEELVFAFDETYIMSSFTIKDGIITIVTGDFYLNVLGTYTVDYCKHKNTVKLSEPTKCTEDGLCKYICTDCRYVYDIPVEATAHTWSDWTTITEPTCGNVGTKTRTCESCNTTETADIEATGNHTYGAWTVTKEATCTKNGVQEKICTVCGDTVKKSIKKLGHAYESLVVEPTCTKDGYTSYTCTRCGNTYTDSETEATGHTWDEGIITTEATKENTGIMTYTCTVCGETMTEEIPMLEELLMLGDVDGDGYIRANDARKALRFSAELETPTAEQLIVADINGDGNIRAGDARKILRAAAELENPADWRKIT